MHMLPSCSVNANKCEPYNGKHETRKHIRYAKITQK